MKKSPFFLFLLLSTPFLLAGCNQESTELKETAETQEQGSQTIELTGVSATEDESESSSNDTSNQTIMPDFDQTALPEKGEEIVVMETNKGAIKIRLFPEFAPKTVENFVGLAKKGYYDGIIFHRIIPNFMIQGGDPTGTGAGGESLWGGKFENEINMNVSNIRGSLAMANVGKDTNGSQFFINQVDNTYLNGYENGKMKDCSSYGVSCHTVFGQVFEGMDIVDAITEVETGPGDKPVEDVVMEKVTVEVY